MSSGSGPGPLPPENPDKYRIAHWPAERSEAPARTPA